MKKIKERFGRIDAMFVNAGVAKLIPFDEVTEEIFDETVNINMKVVFFTLQKAIPLMSKGSAIVLNASINAHLGMPGDYGLWRDQSGRYQHGEGALGRGPGKRYARECRQPRTDHLGASARWTPGNIQQTKDWIQSQVPIKRFGT